MDTEAAHMEASECQRWNDDNDRMALGQSPAHRHFSGSWLSHCEVEISLEVPSGSRQFASQQRRLCGIRESTGLGVRAV